MGGEEERPFEAKGVPESRTGRERHLRYVVKEFMAHYHAERFHQGLGGQLIERPAGSCNGNGAMGKVVCRSRLGGMLNFYAREGA